MFSRSVKKQIEEEYHVSWYIIVYKFLLGLVELLFAFGISFFGQRALSSYQTYVVQELSEDPHDLIIHITQDIVPSLFTHNTFLVIYLAILGGAKIAGAIGLIYKENWGVDLLVGLTAIMFPFQLVQLILKPSLGDFLYILIGLLIALYLVNFRPRKWVRRVLAGLAKR